MTGHRGLLTKAESLAARSTALCIWFQPCQQPPARQRNTWAKARKLFPCCAQHAQSSCTAPYPARAELLQTEPRAYGSHLAWIDPELVVRQRLLALDTELFPRAELQTLLFQGRLQLFNTPFQALTDLID